MQAIDISNFGPVKEFTGNVDGFVILIGPQASGKSTIARLIYFFKMLPLWLASFEPNVGKNAYAEFVAHIRYKFLNLYGPVSHQCDMVIRYEFDDDLYCKVYNKARVVKFGFCKEIVDGINHVLQLKVADSAKYSSSSIGFEGVVNSRVKHAIRTEYDYLGMSKEVFKANQMPLFIPAGRSLISLLSSQVGKIQHDERDIIMSDFLETLKRMRPQFHGSLEEIERIAQTTRVTPPDSERAMLARELIGRVLRGRYAYEGGDEKIYHKNGSGYTKLSYASSGQQESVWILLISYLLILERESVFIVFEEPEAHLFPEGQDAVIRLMSLLHGSHQNNTVVITTHSPYVLSSANNLMYADQVGKKQPQGVEAIIPKKMWLKYSKVKAYYIDEVCEDIMDDELLMIKSETIDSASSLLNNEYDRICSHE